MSANESEISGERIAAPRVKTVRTKERQVWDQIRSQCYSPSNHEYSSVGGRGITVYERWRLSFNDFLEDVGHAPSPTHSFTRLNKQGNYEPGNVKWLTREEAKEFFYKNRKRVEFGQTNRLSIDSVARNGPAFFLVLSYADRREVMQLIRRYPADTTEYHQWMDHSPSWQCKQCRDEAVALVAWERLREMMKDQNLAEITINQALIDLAIERALRQERVKKDAELDTVLKNRAYEDYLFLSKGPASSEDFERLWESRLHDQYKRLHLAIEAVRNPNPESPNTHCVNVNAQTQHQVSQRESYQPSC